MFGKSKPVTFRPYGSRRSRWSLPRWLVLLLCGLAMGAVGVVVVQERYLPPRLSAAASAQLRSALETSNAERVRLKDEQATSRRQLEAALSDRKDLAAALADIRATAERLRGDVASAVASLPPDPRGGGVEVRAGRFTAKAGMLAYDVVLTRDRAAGKPLPGVMQLVVDGQSPRGTTSTVTLKPVTLSIGSHEIVRGSQALPDGFRPRQATILVLDHTAGKPLGTRVMLVRETG